MVAKKYALVLMQRNDWEYFYSRLSLLNELLSNNKDFTELISSKIVKSEYKVKTILELFGDNTKEFENFVCLLADNARLSLIGDIFLNMQKHKMKLDGISTAIVYSASPLNRAVLEALQNDLSNKFNIKIKLENKLCTDEGIKIVLDDLGYELSVSPSYLKQKIKEFILKAI